jgi:hypothetical protein
MNISASQLRRAADIQDKIESLESELNKLLGGSSAATPNTTPPKRRKMSAAAKAKIAAAQRARWAKFHAAKK